MEVKIIEAEHMGFCYGVKRAVFMAEDELRACGAKGNIFSVGSLIHNYHISDQLKAMGLVEVENISTVEQGSTVLVRSHGEGRSFYEAAQERGARLVDATCPNVKRIHDLVQAAAAAGKHIIIIGDKSHPEVEGIAGWCGSEATVLGSEDDLRQATREGRLDSEREYFVVCQTTASEEFRKDLEDRLFSAFRHVESINTICDATHLRQRACDSLSKEVDLMCVVGDKKSSNTAKLVEISAKNCQNTYLVERIYDLPLNKLENCSRIGVTAGASTPPNIIKEVIAKMNEVLQDKSNPMFELMDEIDNQMKRPRIGDVVTGEVIQVSSTEVVLNLGSKKDGVIPKSEIALEPGETLTGAFDLGDEVQAKVIKNDDGEGNILLSKKKVVISEHWDDINEAFENETVIDVDVLKEVNGGVIASFGEVNGFIPMSQLSDRYVEKADEFLGQTLTVKIMRVDQKRNKVVFSHKAVLAEARRSRMVEIWDQISVGDIINGKVMRFTDYGAFVDIGGIDGLLHISEISWGKLKHPTEILELDQEVSVQVLAMNQEREKISLGYKQNLPEPWSVIHDKYEVGQTISGKAVQLKDYGVFVELEPGLDGLVHISEISFKRVNNITDEIHLGQDITAKILEIDQDRKRISLSIKETLDREAYEAELAAQREAEAAASEEVVASEEAAVSETAATSEDSMPSDQPFDQDKDQEFEIPDPDGIDAVDGQSMPSDQPVDYNKDQEFEMPDPDGLDAVGGEIEISDNPEPASEGGPSRDEFDPDKDQEFELPNTGEVEEVDTSGPSKQPYDENKDQEFEMPDPDQLDVPGPSKEKFDPDKDQEFEMPDPDEKEAE